MMEIDTKLVQEACSVARRVHRDADEVVNDAILRAAQTYDPAKGTTFAQWVAVCVRLAAKHFARQQARRREVVRPENWWVDKEVYPQEEADVDQPMFKMLIEHFVEHRPLVNIAAEAGIPLYALRKKLGAAVARLKCNYRPD